MYNIHRADLIQLLSDAVATSHVVCIERSSKIARRPTWAASSPVRLPTSPHPKLSRPTCSGLDSRNERLWNGRL